MNPHARRSLSALGVGLAASALSLACTAPSVFACGSDSQCGAQGLCEDSGWCSFPDAGCGADGRSYGSLALADVVGACMGGGESGSDTSETNATDEATSTQSTSGDGDGDACDPDPCANGTCSDLGTNQYDCSCDSGWMGDDCDTDVNDCSPNPCQNEGSCIDTGTDSFSCTCIDDWEGPTCTMCPGLLLCCSHDTGEEEERCGCNYPWDDDGSVCT